jgi:hypothetical protein
MFTLVICFSMVKIVGWNANSLPFKELELVTFLRDTDDGTGTICGVSEARMNRLGTGFIDISRQGFHVFGYAAHRQGVLVYCSPHLCVTPLDEYCFVSVEFCCVTVKFDSTVIVFPYCHDGNSLAGIEKLTHLMTQLSSRFDSIAVLGDLNATRSNTAGRFLHRFLAHSKFVSLLEGVPTHGVHHLDYALVTESSWKLEIMEELSSDHKPIVLQIDSGVPRSESFYVSWRKFSRQLALCPPYDWESEVNVNVSRMMLFLQDSVNGSTHRRQASSRLRSEKSKYVKFTDELRTMKNRRNRCTRGSQQWKRLNSEFRRALRQANKACWVETQETFAKDTQGSGVWNLLRRAGSGKSPSCRIYNADDVARDFAAFHEIDEKLVPDLEDISCDIRALEAAPYVIIGTTSIEISLILGKLPNQSGVGYDKIPYKAFKNSPPQFLNWLTQCTNAILQSGCWPKAWKHSLVRPLAKSTGGYRPISLLVCLSKIVERIVYSRIRNICVERDILRNQFASSGGCERAVDSLLTHVTSNFPNDSFAVFFDVKKAFDRVIKSCLLRRMVDLEFPAYLVRVVESFLSDRSCAIIGFPDAKYHPQHGVQQGSVLGPILFQILVSDLLEGLDVDYRALYADDMSIIVSSPPGTAPARIQKALDVLSARSVKLGIDFDAKKTRLMVISPRFRRKRIATSFKFKGELLQQCTEYKYLGVVIDSRLTFRSFIKDKVKKTRERINLINRLCVTPGLVRRSLYIGYAQSFLFYCLRCVWPHLAECWKIKIRAVVQVAGRMIAGLTRWSYQAAQFAQIRFPDDFCSVVMTRILPPPYFLHDRALEVPLLRALSGSGWCQYRKFRMHLQDSPKCRFCPCPLETIDHLLLHCPALHCPERYRFEMVMPQGSTSFSALSRLSRQQYTNIARHLRRYVDRWELHI